MGMYTEFKFEADLLPERVREVLPLLEDIDRPGDSQETEEARKARWQAQEHVLFRLERGDQILTGWMCNGVERPALQVTGHHVSVHTNIKNYNQEIEAFLDWITPFVDLATVSGEVEYEEWNRAGPLVIDGGKIDVDRSKAWAD